MNQNINMERKRASTRLMAKIKPIFPFSRMQGEMRGKIIAGFNNKHRTFH